MKRLSILILLFALSLPAQAHSSNEIDSWLDDWQSRIPPAGLVVGSALHLELVDFQQRHPEHFDPTPPVTRSVPNNPGMGSGVEQWRNTVARYFDASEIETALCIMAAESGGNPSAKNPSSTAAGLFQFLRGTWDDVPPSLSGGSYSSGAVYNAEANIRSAAWLQDQYGWSPWSPYNRGLCRGL